MGTAVEKRTRRLKAHARIRGRVSGTAERPRLAVFKSGRYLYAQLIDDLSGHTMAQANSKEKALRESVDGGATSKAAARAVGEVVAERAKEKGIDQCVFDRGGYLYHGRVKQLAEGARSKGPGVLRSLVLQSDFRRDKRVLRAGCSHQPCHQGGQGWQELRLYRIWS